MSAFSRGRCVRFVAFKGCGIQEWPRGSDEEWYRLVVHLQVEVYRQT